MSIIRTFPQHKKIPIKPSRLSETDFNNYDKLKNDDCFNKWFNGKNPLTNRKCKINGKTHMKVQQELKYKNYSYYNEISKIKNYKKYNDESKKIYTKFNDELKNIKLYNDNVDNIIDKIKKVKWENFIMFEDQKYGIPPILDKKHTENNCMGNLLEDFYESCTCHSCEDWGGCGRGYQHMKCEKCNYKYIDTIYYSKNYKGK